MSLVERITAEIRQEIATQGLRPGTPLRSVRELSRHRHISQSTAADVYSALVASGVVEARKGTGHFVARQQRSPRRPAKAESAADSLWTEREQATPQHIEVDAGCGWLPAGWLSGDALRSAMRRVARLEDIDPNGYGNPYGLPELRSHLASALETRSIDATEQQIVLTHGATHALDLLMRTLLRPGDLVIVEEPGYPPLFEMLRTLGVRLLAVPRTAVGPDVDVLAKHLRRARPKALFTNTTLQNPTGTTTSAAVAHRLLELADKHDFQIVEDDIFGQLAPGTPSTLASLDQLRRVAYVTSFSKTISPSLRLGYVASSAATAKMLARAKSTLSLASSELVEHIALNILTHRSHRRRLDTLRRRLDRAQLEIAPRLEAAGVKLSYRPASGMFLWGEISSTEPVTKLWRRAAAEGLLLAPGELFLPQSRPTSFWRFNVAHCDSPRLMEFLQKVSRG